MSYAWQAVKFMADFVGNYSNSKNPGPEDPALVIPRGDLVSWNFNGLWSNGVLEWWSFGRTAWSQIEALDRLGSWKTWQPLIVFPILQFSITPWPRRGLQGRSFTDSPSEILQWQQRIPGKSRSPRRRLYPPACKPYGLEAEPEAKAPIPIVNFQLFVSPDSGESEAGGSEAN